MIQSAETPTKLVFERYFTKEGVDPFDMVEWRKTDAVIKAPDGTVTFEQRDVFVPVFWTDKATGIVAEKYFRVCNGVKEKSARQMIHRVVRTITDAGIAQGLFSDKHTAQVFYDELCYILLFQMFAFNSPVFFNIGVPGVKQQASACFIQKVVDSMQSITELAQKEVMLFKGGSGTGSNLSPLRSSKELLSNGGRASGPVSFMKPMDSFAGATKSGGGTRRAAKMVVLNADHPDIFDFVDCKADAERLAQDLYSTGKYSAEYNKPGNVYDLVPFQNANNSVRVTDEFMRAVEQGGEWSTRFVTTGDVCESFSAMELWDRIGEAAWLCGDPGIQFDTTTNKWHTVPNSGRINASNPCSEYLYLDDTACNLGSWNLMKFYRDGEFRVKDFSYANTVAITAMEILVGYSEYPSEAIAENSRKFRPLGIGYANLGALLMNMGLAYDSDEGRAVAAGITSLMSGTCYKMSALMAGAVGAFEEFDKNCYEMTNVIEMHRKAHGGINAVLLDQPGGSLLWHAGKTAWDAALALGLEHGYRNGQISVLAPTGTISFLMDCDTTGVEPMLALIVWKKLVGGGMLKMPNAAVPAALRRLGYAEEQIELICKAIEDSKKGELPYDLVNKEHHKIFQTAIGEDPVSVDGHLLMMAAVQPFLSGGISKTVNMPNTATVQEIKDAYFKAWKLGLKCVALFRDGCKLSQPASGSAATKEARAAEAPVECYTGLKWGERKRLSKTRNAITHKFNVGGQEGYLHVGLYDDGSVGEVFVDIAKAGSMLSGVMSMAATAISIALQHGAPLETFIDKFRDTQYAPQGYTGDEKIRFASSIGDYIAKWLELKFIMPQIEGLAAEIAKDIPAVIEKLSTVDFSGPPCSSCHNGTRRAGSCWVCDTCGQTTGCG